MCNLYSMTATVDELRRVFGSFAGDAANLPSFGDIYPNRSAPVLRAEGGDRALDLMTWGFRGPASGGGRPLRNVRNLASSFWRSKVKNPERRCIVPVTKFCEWTAEVDPATKRKRKIWFGLQEAEQSVLAFAGIWRPAEEGRAMAFLTCEANQLVGANHLKAMPVILDPADVRRWLTDEMANACSLAVPFPDERMRQFA